MNKGWTPPYFIVRLHSENYKKRHGYYPFRILAYKIHLNRTNRHQMKELGLKRSILPDDKENNPTNYNL